MDKLQFAKELEQRTEKFADRVIDLCKKLSRDLINNAIVDQLIRSSGSIGANYIEANESLSKKDFFHRIRICRKESKETRFWLRRLLTANPDKEAEVAPLLKEALEFVLIFSKVVSHA